MFSNNYRLTPRVIGCYAAVLLLLASYLEIRRSNESSDMSLTQNQLIEICDNSIDDDNDGLIDLNDQDCDCPILEPISLIPNPSFEEKICCPSNFSQLYCAQTWIQASEATTDYIHNCGWQGWADYLPPRPFPDGEAIIGFRDGRIFMDSVERNWKEYAGACLLSPLKAGTAYRIEFDLGFIDEGHSPPIDVTFFGTTDCMNLPFGIHDPAFGCPTNGPGWVRLASTIVAGRGWIKTSIDLTPSEDIYAIAIGPSCQQIVTTIPLYYGLDNLVLDDRRSFDIKITDSEHPCSENYSLEVPLEPDRSYQWYKDGIALVNENNHRLLQIHGEGNYQVRILGDQLCQVTKVFNYQIPYFQSNSSIKICEGEQIIIGGEVVQKPGLYTSTLKSIDGCDSIVTLKVEVLPPIHDTVFARIFKGETYRVEKQQFSESGNYTIPLLSIDDCDSLVYLNLSYYDVYFPNVFSPNGDGLHDKFIISGNSDLLSIETLIVYNRWGEILYKGNQLDPSADHGWDGIHFGEKVKPGVYSYLTYLIMKDGIRRAFSGDITLIR